MNCRSSRLAAVLAALTVAVLPSVAGAAEEQTPVLWEGMVRAADGTPAGEATVVAYARSADGQLQPGVRLEEVARTTSGDGGRFTLRAPAGGAIAAAADPGGWTSLMVIATGSGGTSLAVDSVAWQPLDGVHGFSAGAGRWVTDPADLASAPRTATIDEAAVPSAERPETLVLSGAGRLGRTVRSFGGPSQAPGSFCMLVDRRDLGKQPVTVGHMHMERGWTGHFVYTNTKSTSVEVGVSMDGGTFSGQGSKTMTTEASAGGEDLQDPSNMRNRWYYIAMTFTRYHWRCNEFRGNFEAYTIEPSAGWDATNDYYDDNRTPRCNRKYEATIGSRRDFQRRKGSGTTFSAGFSAGGFTGSTSVATSDTVDQKWMNGASRSRRLCGESAPLTHFTRARTEA